MSTVLIGILGVIIFIGLAIGVVMILGDDFRNASSDTKAAAAQQQLKQVADAVNMAILKTNSTVMSQGVNGSSTLIPRFLKVVPSNPVIAANGVVLLDSTGNYNVANEAKIATMNFGLDEKSRQVCESISRNAGQTADNATFDTSAKGFALSALTTAYGCQSNGSNYIAFQKI